MLNLITKQKYSIGVDIGASHISCGLYNRDLKILDDKLYKYNKMNKSEEISCSTNKFIKEIINLIDKLIMQNNIDLKDVSSIGLGCPGGIDKSEGIFFGSTSLNVCQIDWRKELKKYNVNVYVENDCTCAGICEHFMNNWEKFIMFTLGSGLGISYMIKNKCIDENVWDIAEINKKNGDKHDKYIKSFESLSKKYNSVKNENYERGAIFECIKKQDNEALGILKEYIQNFIQGIIKIENKYKIGKYSIGGGMSEYSEFFIKEIQNKLPNIIIKVAKYKNDSGIIGGALLEQFC